METKFDKNRITIDGVEHAIDLPIRVAIPLSDRVILLLDEEDLSEDDPRYERNVIALGKDGEMLWRIEDVGFKGNPCPYSGLGFDEDGVTILVYDWGGACYNLDPETGKLSNLLFTR